MRKLNIKSYIVLSSLISTDYKPNPFAKVPHTLVHSRHAFTFTVAHTGRRDAIQYPSGDISLLDLAEQSATRVALASMIELPMRAGADFTLRRVFREAAVRGR